MFVVIMGDLDRDTQEDKDYVMSLLDSLKSEYSDLTIISGACKSGIGFFVRDRCIRDKKNPDFGFVEYDIKPWTRLSEARLAQVFMSRNPALLEIGEIFHILPSGRTTGHIPDLISRVKKAGMPLVIHHLNGEVEKINYTTNNEIKKCRTGSLASGDLKSQLE